MNSLDKEYKGSLILLTHQTGCFLDSVRSVIKNCQLNTCVACDAKEMILFAERGSFTYLVIDSDSIYCNDDVIKLFVRNGFTTPYLIVLYKNSKPNIKPDNERLFVVNIDHFYETLSSLVKIYESSFQPKKLIYKNERALTNNIVHYLMDLGLYSKYHGFEYIVEVQKIILTNQRLLKSLSKYVYPIVASKFNTSSANIEKNIRHLIQSTWRTSSKTKELLAEYFINPPSNRVFLCTIAQNLKFLVD